MNDSVKWSYDLSTDIVVSYNVEYTGTEASIRVQQEDFDREIQQA